MTEHGAGPGDLEEELRALGRDLHAGATPDVRDSVARSIASDTDRNARRPRRARRIAALTTAAVLAGTAGAAAASPQFRGELARLFRFGGVEVARTTASNLPSVAAPGITGLHLGRRVDPAEARRAATFALAQPKAAGRPSDVLLLRSGAGAIVTFVYAPTRTLPRSPVTGTGAILTEFAGSIDRIVFQKILAGITRTRATTVNGARAIFADGPQELFLVEADVGPYGIAPRPSANSLIWAAGGVTYRLEADLPLDRMRALAESVR